MSLEGKLFLSSAILFAIMVILAIIGERSLFLFDGDRALAARTNKIGFALLAGTGFALAMPATFKTFAAKLRSVIAKSQVRGSITNLVGSKTFPRMMLQTGYILMIIFLLATCIAVFSIW